MFVCSAVLALRRWLQIGGEGRAESTATPSQKERRAQSRTSRGAGSAEGLPCRRNARHALFRNALAKPRGKVPEAIETFSLRKAFERSASEPGPPERTALGMPRNRRGRKDEKLMRADVIAIGLTTQAQRRRRAGAVAAKVDRRKDAQASGAAERTGNART